MFTIYSNLLTAFIKSGCFSLVPTLQDSKIVASTQMNGIDFFFFFSFDKSDIFNDMKQTKIQTEKLGSTKTFASPTQ